MSSIKDTMVDTSFVEEFAAYLRKEHDVSAWVEDGDGAFVPLGGTEVSAAAPLAVLSLRSGERLRRACGAPPPPKSALLRAEPHILLGVKGIGHLLLRDVELLQTSDEMLQLSGQMAFLFNLARKTIGVNEIDEFCRIVLDEIAPAIQADFGIVHTKGRGDQEIGHPAQDRGAGARVAAREGAGPDIGPGRHRHLQPGGRDLRPLLPDQGEGRADRLHRLLQEPGQAVLHLLRKEIRQHHRAHHLPHRGDHPFVRKPAGPLRQHGEIAGRRHRRQGPVHPRPFVPGRPVLQRHRPAAGHFRRDAARPGHRGVHARPREDRRARIHPGETGEADGRGIPGDQEASPPHEQDPRAHPPAAADRGRRRPAP